MFNMVKKKYPENWIRYYRNISGMTAEELGKEINLSKDGVTLIERQERSLSVDTAKKIADVFGVHYTDLIDGPAELMVARNEAQKKILAAMDGMSDQAQQAFATGVLSGWNTQKTEAPSKQSSSGFKTKGTRHEKTSSNNRSGAGGAKRSGGKHKF